MAYSDYNDFFEGKFTRIYFYNEGLIMGNYLLFLFQVRFFIKM